MPSLKLPNLLRRRPDAPTLKERAAALKAGLLQFAPHRTGGPDKGRRALVAGTIAASIPLPAVVVPAAKEAHPDAILLDLDARLQRARAIEGAARMAHLDARQLVETAIEAERPGALVMTDAEYAWTTIPGQALARLHPRIRVTAPRTTSEWACFLWTGAGLRTVIEGAVPALGTGGTTPHMIRRWKALLPLADEFDALIAIVEEMVDLRRLEQARRQAESEYRQLSAEIAGRVATTPEGLAALVRVTGTYGWAGMSGAWPNLLRSAANVAGIDPASLEHEYARSQEA